MGGVSPGGRDGPGRAPGAQVDALVADNPDRPALPTPEARVDAGPAAPTPEQLRLEEARKLARDNPIAVANIVRDWMTGGAGES